MNEDITAIRMREMPITRVRFIDTAPFEGYMMDKVIYLINVKSGFLPAAKSNIML